jgi:hypothetical protein
MKNLYFLIDNICRVAGYDRYKITGIGFSLEYIEDYGYTVNYDTGLIVYKETLEGVYGEFVKLSSNSSIKEIMTKDDIIQFNYLGDLFECVDRNLVLSYDALDIYFIQGKFIRLFKDFQSDKTAKIFINDYRSLVRVSGNNIRYVSEYKDITLQEFIDEQGEDVEIRGIAVE